MINKTKNHDQKIMNVSFNEIDVLDSAFEYEKMEVKYTAGFYDKYLRDYDGFYYDGCNVEPFKNKATSDFGDQTRFDSVEEIINLIPDAIEYHKDTTNVLIKRFVSFIDENDEIILYIAAGQIHIEI